MHIAINSVNKPLLTTQSQMLDKSYIYDNICIHNPIYKIKTHYFQNSHYLNIYI